MTLSVSNWIGEQLKSDDDFAAHVEARLAELRIEQELVNLREKLGMTQTQLARLARVSQSYLAKLESGAAKNIELRTLVRTATALGAKVRIELELDPEALEQYRNEEARGGSVKKMERFAASPQKRGRSGVQPA